MNLEAPAQDNLEEGQETGQEADRNVDASREPRGFDPTRPVDKKGRERQRYSDEELAERNRTMADLQRKIREIFDRIDGEAAEAAQIEEGLKTSPAVPAEFIKRIAGDERGKEIISGIVQKNFNERWEEWGQHEIQKTESEKEIIKRVEDVVDEMVVRWGGNPAPLPMENVYVIKEGSFATMEWPGVRGGCQGRRGKIAVERANDSRYEFANVFGHELFHFKSYKSVTSVMVGPSERKFGLYRSGLRMMDWKNDPASPDKKEYFGLLEEAIVSECGRIAMKKMVADPSISKEAHANERLKQWVIRARRRQGAPEEMLAAIDREMDSVPEAERVMREIELSSHEEEERENRALDLVDRLYKEGKIGMQPHRALREKMYGLFSRIVRESNGRFRNQEEVFDQFARANFTGNYLPLARMVESILGKGSFRKIANDFADEGEGKAA